MLAPSPFSPDLAASPLVSAPVADSSAASPPRRRIHGLRQERQDAARLKAALIEHVGGAPSPAQSALIDTLAELKVKMAVFDKRFIEEGGMSPHSRREYLAFVNSFGRLLAQLGPPAAARPPTPAEALARARALLHPKAPA